MTSCGEQLVKLLENYGIEVVFGIPGVHTIELYRGVASSSMRHVTPRHEQGAGFMADGYARATGKVAACFIITGPGMTNIATAMAQALADSIPMLVISSVNRTHQLGLGEGRLHELADQRLLANQVARFSHTLMRPDELPQVLARAFAVFESQRPGPVHIEIPIDVIEADANHLSLTPLPVPFKPGPAPDAIENACRVIEAAKQPTIVVGGGAIDAAPVIRELAERLAAPVVSTVNAKGILPADHPLAVGGSASSSPVRELLAASDVVIAFGTEFGETDYDFYFTGLPAFGGQLIRIDIDAAQLTRNVPADIAIVSDAALAASAFVRHLAVSEGNGAARAEAARDALKRQRDPGYEKFFAVLRRCLPNLVIAGDSAQPLYYAWLHYETDVPRSYFHSASGFGTLGYALPAAIGASLGRPDVPVVGLIGDGASQFSLGEMASAVEAGIDVIFIVWNNHGYAEIKRFMQDAEVDTVGVDIGAPDFVAVAEAMGCVASRADSFEALEEALLRAHRDGGTQVIEVMQAALVGGNPQFAE